MEDNLTSADSLSDTNNGSRVRPGNVSVSVFSACVKLTHPTAFSGAPDQKHWTDGQVCNSSYNYPPKISN